MTEGSYGILRFAQNDSFYSSTKKEAPQGRLFLNLYQLRLEVELNTAQYGRCISISSSIVEV